MSFVLNLPPSMVAKQAKAEQEGNEDADISERKKTREDYKKMKELEEMRKLGNAPAMTDEEGKDINPHIPQYVMQAPWYLGIKQATLKHQRIQQEKVKQYSSLGEWYKKGVVKGAIATKYRKGACENCGAMTHKKKDCLERPRKVGAKYTGEDFAPDEHIQPQLSFDFDGKRDMWNGADIELHQTRLKKEFRQIEEAKQALKAEKLESDMLNEEDGEKKDDDHKYEDDIDMPGQKFETKQRITVRNLRIREDTAKYLYNLDVNSAYYDPKTRSMRANPDMVTNEYAGDNFVRISGDAHEFAKKQMFAWEAYERGADVHLQADPTKTELLSQEVQSKKEMNKTMEKETIIQKYGGEAHLKAPPKQLLLAQTEDYVEYSRTGVVIKGQEKQTVLSRYEEDVYINNHTSVWGSYWSSGQWGYKCCHSLIKLSYCTGEAGKNAVTQLRLTPPQESARPESSSSKTDSLHQLHHHRSDRTKKDMDSYLSLDERKRPYNSLYETPAPTEEEIETYRMKRPRPGDPMAEFTEK